MDNSPKFAIGPIPRTNDWGSTNILKNLKQAVESLLGQGKTESPKGEKAMTGNDLVKLGLITEDDLRKL